MNIRQLERAEISRIWEIDRREIVENIYRLEAGQLRLQPDYFDMQGWPPGEAELYTRLLLDCFDRGGTFWGAFRDEILVGACVLESKLIGRQHDRLQLKFLHVSRDQRGQGLGAALFGLAAAKARGLGIRQLYISATPSEHTINYYLRLGCRLARELEPELVALEPEDIHLEYEII